MHEMGITQDVIDAITVHVGGMPVSRVVLEIGRLSGVHPEAFRSYFDLCAEGSPLEGAELEIRERSGLARCCACGADVRLDAFFASCACGNSDLDWQEGDEVKVLHIEVKTGP